MFLVRVSWQEDARLNCCNFCFYQTKDKEKSKWVFYLKKLITLLTASMPAEQAFLAEYQKGKSYH